MRLRDRLKGQRILLTGVTGFVGEALLHRILRDLDETSVVVLVRPTPTAITSDSAVSAGA